MKLKMKASLLIFAVLSASPALSAKKPKAEPDLKVSSSNHVALKDAVIAALRVQNETLTARVSGLAQLLYAARRESSDAAARSAISELEKRILRGMGLSSPECKVQTNGTIECETKVEDSEPADLP